mgnify:CR=1 FL=1
MNTNSPVIGLLFGTLTDDNSNCNSDTNTSASAITSSRSHIIEEVIDATEAIYSVELGVTTGSTTGSTGTTGSTTGTESIPILNVEENIKKMELWSGVFDSHRVIGWYSIGTNIQNWHIETHQALQNIVNTYNSKSKSKSNTTNTNTNSNANVTNDIEITLPLLFLLMNCTETPVINNQEQELPLFFFQMTSIDHHFIFMKIENNYKLTSAPHESVCIDALMKSNTNNTITLVNEHNHSMVTSINILNNKIDAIIELLLYYQNMSNTNTDTNNKSNTISISKSSSEYQNFIRKVCLLTNHLPDAPNTLNTYNTSNVSDTRNNNNDNNNNSIDINTDTGLDMDMEIDESALQAMLTSYLGLVSKMKEDMSNVDHMYKKAYE